MIDYIWGVMIVVGGILCLITGNISILNININETIKTSVGIIINMIGTICFWNGIVNIIINTKFKNIVFYILQPLINIIFPKLKENIYIKEKIGTTMTFNILGIGNAATAVGMEVLRELEMQNNTEEISDEIFLFIIINTVSIQLIPTTIIALRNSYNSKNINNIIFPILINSLITFIIVVLISKIYLKNRRKSKNV